PFLDEGADDLPPDAGRAGGDQDAQALDAEIHGGLLLLADCSPGRLPSGRIRHPSPAGHGHQAGLGCRSRSGPAPRFVGRLAQRDCGRRYGMPTVAIIGTGLIGRSWAIVFAAAGWQVRLTDASAGALEAAPGLIAEGLADLAGHGLVDDPEGAAARV